MSVGTSTESKFQVFNFHLLGKESEVEDASQRDFPAPLQPNYCYTRRLPINLIFNFGLTSKTLGFKTS